MHLIITRPHDDALPLKAKLEAMGHSATLLPLLKIVPRENIAIPDKPYQLICATSANALKHVKLSTALKQKKIFTVGPQSLAAAQAAGFTLCQSHGGDVHGLVAHIKKTIQPGAGPILYLSGAETSADLQKLLQDEGFTVDKIIVYDAIIEKPAGLAEAISTADGVLLYSPRSARIWVDTADGKQAASLSYFCLSSNVAKVLPNHWRTRVAKTPDESAMLALLD
jgi:uroporphyrinogen-III synthase